MSNALKLAKQMLVDIESDLSIYMSEVRKLAIACVEQATESTKWQEESRMVQQRYDNVSNLLELEVKANDELRALVLYLLTTGKMRLRHPGFDGPAPMGGGDYERWNQASASAAKDRARWDAEFTAWNNARALVGLPLLDRYKEMQ